MATEHNSARDSKSGRTKEEIQTHNKLARSNAFPLHKQNTPCHVREGNLGLVNTPCAMILVAFHLFFLIGAALSIIFIA